MKKTILIFSLTAVLSALPVFVAEADSVYSANIVGFHRLELVDGTNFVGLNFKNTADQIYFNVQDLFDTSALRGGTGPGASDQMLLWNAADQQYVRLWLFDSGSGSDFDGSWVDSVTGDVANQEVYPGDGFWLINTGGAPAEIILAGEVENAEIFTHAALDGYVMMASAWPVDIAVNDMSLSGLKGGTGPGASDEMLLWNAANQQYVRLWLFDSGSGADFDGSWVDRATGDVADQEISAGSAFWLIRQTDDELTEGKSF